jgi:hypothetical protein
MNKKSIFLIFLCLFLISEGVFSRDYYISPSGNDSNSGTSSSSPFKTLERARDAVRTYISGGMTENINVSLAAGIYPVTSHVLFTEADSGRNGYTITYKCTGNSEPIIIGGIPVTAWEAYTPFVFRANIEASVGGREVTTLFENRREGTRVNNPLGYTISQMAALLDGSGEFYYDAGNGYLYYNPRNTPIDSQETVVPLDFNIIELKGTSDTNRVQNLNFKGLTFFATSYSDAYLDSYYDEKGLIHIENASDINIEECRILGAGVSGIVLGRYAQNITIDRCRIDGAGLHGISLRGYLPGEGGFSSDSASDVNKNNTIQNCYITGTGSHRTGGVGIRIIQSGRNTIERNTIRNTASSGVHIHGPAGSYIGSTLYGTRVTESNQYSFIHARSNNVRQNDISMTGAASTGSGVYTAYAGLNNKIDNNIIHDIYSASSSVKPTGICIAAPSKSVIARNNIIHSIRSSNNFAHPIFIVGNDCTIQNNIFADNDPNHDFVYVNSRDSARDLIITNNICRTPGATYIHDFEQWHEYDMTSDNNLFYHPSGEYKVKTPYETMTISAWQQHFDQSSVFGQDPLFEEAESHYYTIQNYSPVRNIDFTTIDQESLGIPTDFPYRYARDLIEAEHCNSTSGITNKVTTIRVQSSGNYAEYTSVYFDEQCRNFELRYSCSAAVAESTGRYVSIRLDNTGGTELERITLPGTGGITKYRQKSISISPPSGKRDLYLVFGGSSPDVKVDWFRFYDTYVNPVVPVRTAPIVRINSPAHGSVIRAGQPILISGTATDLDGIITSIDLYINNDNHYTLPANPNFSYNWNPAGTGEHSITVRVTDDSGEVGQDTITVTISNEGESPPVVTIIQPKENEIIKSPVLELVVIAIVTDPDDNLQSIELIVDGMMKDNEPEEIEIDTYRLVCPGNELGPGTHHITVRAKDTGGFQGEASIDIIVDSSSHLIAHWTFDSISNRQALDSSVSGLHATIYGSIQVTSGINNQAYRFDGKSAVKSKMTLLNLHREFTIAGWVKPEKFGNRVGLWGQYGVLGFGFFQEELMQVFTYNCGNLEPAYPFSLNTWHHIALTADGSVLRVYFDAVPTEPSTPTPVSNYGSSSSSFNIGGGGIFDPTGNYFTGCIDDVYLYNRALDEAEIRMLAKRDDNIPPSVRIMEPRNKSKIEGPATINIKVNASDRDGEIDYVEIWLNDDSIIDNDEPYEQPWTGVPPGDYTITAKAVDNDFGEASASIVVTVVQQGQDLIGYWSFDEEAGNEAFDRSGNDNHGTITGGAVWTKGISGSALKFNGHSIVKTNKGLFNGLTAFTAAAWVKPSEIRERNSVLGQNHALIFAIKRDPGGDIFTVWTAGNVYTDTQYVYPVEEWHHLAAVGTGESLILYVDGKRYREFNYPCANYGSSEMDFAIGGLSLFDGGPGHYFRGIIDEVYLYSRALEEYEIKNLALLNVFNAPEVIITSPANYTIFPMGQAIEISAAVKDEFIPQLRMEFYANDVFISVDESDPYTATWTPETNGTFTIRAKAITWEGYWSEAAITITVELTGDGYAVDIEGDGETGGEDDGDGRGNVETSESGETPFHYEDTGTDTLDDEESVIVTKHMHSSKKNVFEELNQEDPGEIAETKGKEKEKKEAAGIASSHSSSQGDDGIVIYRRTPPEPTPAFYLNINSAGESAMGTETQVWYWDPHTQSYHGPPQEKPFPLLLVIGIILLVIAAVATEFYILRKFIFKKKEG